MASDACRLSVVMPAFNEEGRIAESILETVKALSAGRVGSWELIVVNDGSRDRTALAAAEVIRARRLGRQVRLVSYAGNLGKGWALRAGCREARGDFVAFLDADLDIPPELVPRYLKLCEQEQVDVVVGSKRHPESQLEYSRLRRFISNLYYAFNRVFFALRVKDTQSGIKLFRREMLERVLPKLLGKRFAFDLELLVNIRDCGGRILEAPLVIRNHREYGRIGVLALWHAFVDTVAIFYRLRILRFYNWEMLPESGGRELRFSLLIDVKGYSRELPPLVDLCRDLAWPEKEIILLADRGNFSFPGVEVVETRAVSTAEKYNIGARHAGGDVLVLLHQGHLPEDGWLERANGYFQADRKLLALCGPLAAVSDGGFTQAVTAWVRQSLLIAGRYTRFYRQRRQRRVRRALLENLFIRRRAFLDAEGIDAGGLPRLEAFSLLEKLDAASGRVLYSPDLVLKDRPISFISGYLPAVGNEALRQGMLCSRLARRRFFLPAYLNSFLVLALLLGAAMAAASPFFARIYLSVLPFLGIPLLLFHGRGLYPLRAAVTIAGILLVRLWRGLQFLRGLFTK